MNYSIYNRGNKLLKYHIYEYYSILDYFAEEYEKITRKQMFKRCVDIYNDNPEIIFELLDIEELELLFSLEIDSTFKYDRKYLILVNTFLLSYDEDLEYLSVTKELVDVVKYCKKQYLMEKDNIERDKEKYHLIVGLFRVFGALTKTEISYILKELNVNYKPTELLNSPYAKRFIDYDWCSFYDDYSLKELSIYKYELLDTHPKKIRLKHTYEQYVEVGKHYLVKSSPEYKKIAAHPKVFDFYNSIDKNALILYKGCGIGNRFFDYEFKMFFEGLNEEEKAVFLTFFDLLPTYVLQKNQNNILSDEDGKLLYNVLLPFLNYAALNYDLDFDYDGKKFNSYHVYDIIQECIKNNFNIVDNYINDSKLKDEEKEIVLGLKKYIKGPFIIVKHLKDGSVFLTEKGIYHVKGILTSIESMEYLADTPVVCETVLIPFKNQITYFLIIAPLSITIGTNMRKQIENEYKTKKAKIIKNLWE